MNKLTKSDIAYILLQKQVTVTPDKFGHTTVFASGINFRKSFDSTDTDGILDAVYTAHTLLSDKLVKFNYLSTRDDMSAWLTGTVDYRS